jgi:large subunit ribosomal protein L29
MNAQEIREMTAEELEHSVAENRRELFNLRLQNQKGQLENPAQINIAKRNVARLLTEQNMRARNS